MTVSINSKLFIGSYFDDIDLSEETVEEMVEEQKIIKVTPYKDAETEECYFGVDLSVDDLLSPDSLNIVKSRIEYLQDLFGCLEVGILHLPNVI